MVQVARETGRICQAGTQNRSNGSIAAAGHFIRDGKLGDVTLARTIIYGRRGAIGKRGVYEVPSHVDYNLWLGPGRAFDVYPFILLNLLLSCLAAVQAPIIMMSQKRQEAKDRLRALNDYQVNLKAEIEIRHLHEKIDHLLSRQWERLTEIQQFQIEILEEARKGR